MSDSLDFTIHFHSAFRVSTGSAASGYDAVADLADPLPASSFKGVMRSVARFDLCVPADVVGEVFGSTGEPSPWHWLMTFPTSPALANHHRVAIDPSSHAARKDHLQLGQVLWCPSAHLQVTQVGGLNSDRRADHRLILTAAAHAVHALGAQRRRGLGWVSVDGGDPMDDAALTRLLELRGAPA